MLRQLMGDEAGVILSAELVLILTIAVLAMIVGLNEVAVAVNEELNDISNAVGNLDQSYSYSGYKSYKGKSSPNSIKNSYSGGSWNDDVDDCDCNDAVISCDFTGEKGGYYHGY